MSRSGDFGGDDEIHGDNGPGFGGLGFETFDDVILGQQGDDLLFGGIGEDDIIGGHNVLGGADGDDTIDGGAGADVVLGDNGQIRRILTGVDLDTYARYLAPFSDVIRIITTFDNIDKISGNDRILGGAGRDILHGQRGADRIDGQSGDDNIFGELGSDVLFGGDGHDVVLAEAGQILPIFNADGFPMVNADGSWRRTIVLEDDGVIVDYLNGGVDFGIAFMAGLAERLSRVDLVLIGGMTSSAVTPSVPLLILVNFVAASTNEIHGGSGNDILFGGSAADLILGAAGDDQIFGGLGDDQLDGQGDDDLVVGDDITNSALRSYLSRVLHGVRLTDDLTNSGLTVLAPGGSLVVPDGAIRPEALACGSPGAPVGQVLTGASYLGATLVRSDGTVIPHILAVSGNFPHDPDRTPGNDRVSGGTGDDVLVGDHLDVWQELPDIASFTVAEALLQAEIDRLISAFSQLGIDHDLAEATSGGVRRFHPGGQVASGNDAIVGGRGRDQFTGDSAELSAPAGGAVVIDEATYLVEAAEFYATLLDMGHITADLADLVTQAHRTVLVGLVEQALRFGAPAAGTPRLHTVTMGNDLLQAKANPLVFGDEDPDVLVGADRTFFETADPLTLSPQTLDDLLAVFEERDEGQPIVRGVRAVLPPVVDVSAVPFDRSCTPLVAVDRLVIDPVDVVLNNPASWAAPSMLTADDN
ncbi:MAG: calcium-binding protein [Acidimicrobiales bacterium]